MASHKMIEKETISGRRFEIVEFSQNLRYVRRHMIDGKPVKRVMWEKEKAIAISARDGTWQPPIMA